MENDKKLEQDKQAFFAQYWGQNVFCIKTHFITDEVPFNESGIEIDQHIFPIKLDRKVYGNVESRDYYLELTDLRNITDDHAIEVAKLLFAGHDYQAIDIRREARTVQILFNSKNRDKRYNYIFIYTDGSGFSDNIHRKTYGVLPAYDFLRRNGYLLPYAGYTTDQLIEMGWVKLKSIL